jgi:hypothetical protein
MNGQQFFQDQKENSRLHTYSEYIRSAGAISRLFSVSEKPFLHYRMVEKLFCAAFDAEDLGRADASFDARIGSLGFGVKTYLLKGAAQFEKVAEFNANSNELRRTRGIKLAKMLAEYRNARILHDQRVYGISDRVYHIVGREKSLIRVFHAAYNLIDADTIHEVDDSTSSLKFCDQNNEYSFNHSKSTLYQRFVMPEHTYDITVNIVTEPISMLIKLSSRQHNDIGASPMSAGRTLFGSSQVLMAEEEMRPGIDYVVLPLYSPDNKRLQRDPIVPLKSQLNQWNGLGRVRDDGEVYISIPRMIHKKCPDFFPSNDTVFVLVTPTREELSAKVCQDGGKALMTNPNNALADWLLRGVLMLEPRQILTYKHLQTIGVDAVKVIRKSNHVYHIEFSHLNSYEDFIGEI